MKKPVVLRIFKGEQLLGVKQFTESQIVLGKPGDVQVPLEGEKVSIIHAAIEERDSGYFICDLGSENGTFKNGETVLDAPIESGDIIQVGEFRIEFFIGVPKPKSAPATVEMTSAAPAAKPAAPQPPPVAKAPSAPAAAAPTPAPAAKPVEAKKESKPVGSSVAANVVSAPIIPPGALDPMPAPVMAGATVGSASMAGPRVAGGAPKTARRGAATAVPSKRKKTFAPPSKYSDVRDYVKPSKGTVVEVLVAWGERVIETYHFSEKKTVTLGSSPGADIVLPVLSSRVRKIPLVQIDRAAKVLISPEMTGELVRGQTSSSFVELVRQNKMTKDGASYAINLEQGEMVRIEMNDQISIIIRYTSDSPKPLIAPFLDLTTAEFSGIVLAAVLIAILRLYTFLYTPPVALPGDEGDEPVRIAIIATPTPLPPVPVPVPKEVATPPPTPPPIVKATPQPTKAPEITQAQQKKATKPVTNLTNKNDPGASAKAAPNPDKTAKTKVGSVKQGGAIKQTQNQGSQFNSKPDKNKEALFSAFGGGGAQDKLSKSHTGAGELAGMANAANGKSGFDTNRAGNGLGAVKDTGAGDNGKALEAGIKGGIGTTGRGSGQAGYGTGGLGNKAGSKIVTGGSGESFSGTIDREAIRRVLKANERTIKSCYERQLNRKPDLFGKLVLTWDIAEGGRALNVHVGSNELGNAEVANCIMDKLKNWKFPDPPANQTVEVSYPWFFSN
jgi:hypothetical protein